MKVILVICLLFVLFGVVMLVKNEITYNNLMKLTHAIYAYNLDLIDQGKYDELLPYDCFPSYETVLLRLFDWGYGNILPTDIMDKIRPFIEE